MDPTNNWARTQVRSLNILHLRPAALFLALILSCGSSAQPTDCFRIVTDTVRCTPDGFAYQFRFLNASPNPVNALSVYPTEGVFTDRIVSPEQLRLPETVPPGDTLSEPVTILFEELDGDGNFCFDLVARQLLPAFGTSVNCCFLTHCVETPPPPEILLVDTLITGCAGDMPQLDASGSRPERALFSWIVTNGPGRILSGANGPRPLTEGNGNYRLLLRDPATNCTATDSVEVRLSEGAVARSDSLVLDGGNTGILDVTDNDVFTGTATVMLVAVPDNGTATLTPDGLLSYQPPPCFTGVATLTYELTDDRCPEASSRANVTLAGAALRRYNVITPDGDGLNETFFFDELVNCPTDYPDNRIEIFNRWGDVVYRAAPYRNEWAGTNQRGGPLPEATYYYILRLDLGEGMVIRGDVTVLR